MTNTHTINHFLLFYLFSNGFFNFVWKDDDFPSFQV